MVFSLGASVDSQLGDSANNLIGEYLYTVVCLQEIILVYSRKTPTKLIILVYMS